jgi:hypothetical protein
VVKVVVKFEMRLSTGGRVRRFWIGRRLHSGRYGIDQSRYESELVHSEWSRQTITSLSKAQPNGPLLLLDRV